MRKDPYDRPKRLIGEGAQEKVSSIKAGIVGGGALGQVLGGQCSKIGVAELHVLDIDKLKDENLANSFLFNKGMLGMDKDRAAIMVAKQLSLKRIRAKNYHFDITDPENLQQLLKFMDRLDVVFGCLDNGPARFALNAAALKSDVKYIDLGIEGFAGRIRFIDRSRGCYACDPLVPENQITNIYKFKGKEDGCDYAPTVTILPTVLATTSYALLEGLKYLGIVGEAPQYDYLYFEFLTPSNPVKMKISKRKECVICGEEGMIWW